MDLTVSQHTTATAAGRRGCRLNEFGGGKGNFCYPSGFSPLIWQADLSVRVDGRRRERKGKEEGWIFRLPKTFSLSSLLPSFHRRSLSFLSAAINELYQLAAAAKLASEAAEMGYLLKFPAAKP